MYPIVFIGTHFSDWTWCHWLFLVSGFCFAPSHFLCGHCCLFLEEWSAQVFMVFFSFLFLFYFLIHWFYPLSAPHQVCEVRWLSGWVWSEAFWIEVLMVEDRVCLSGMWLKLMYHVCIYRLNATLSAWPWTDVTVRGFERENQCFFFWFFILSQTATATLNELFITEWLHVSRECIKVNFSWMFIHLWAKMFIKSFPEIWFGLSTLLKSNCTLAAVDVENFDSAGVSVISQSRHSSTRSCASKSFAKNSLNTPAAGQN